MGKFVLINFHCVVYSLEYSWTVPTIFICYTVKETKKLFHIDPDKVTRIIVNESEGKDPEQYVIQELNLNFKNLVATTPLQTNGK